MNFTNTAQFPKTAPIKPKANPVEKNVNENKKFDEATDKKDFNQIVNDLVEIEEKHSSIREKAKIKNPEEMVDPENSTSEDVIIEDVIIEDVIIEDVIIEIGNQQAQQEAIQLLMSLLGVSANEAETMLTQVMKTGESPQLTAMIATLNTEQKQQIVDGLKNLIPKINIEKEAVVAQETTQKVVQNVEKPKDGFKNTSDSGNNTEGKPNITAKPDGSAKIQAEANFKNTIAEAKSMIKEANGTSDNKRNVNNEEIAQLTQRMPQEQPKIDIQTNKYEGMSFNDLKESMMAQVKTGITTRIPAGGKLNADSEFVIKLQPDGLGEITVKMTKNPSGITLNILAQNSDTHKMLNAELMNLKEALRPYNAHIEQVVQSKDNLSGNLNHLFDGNQQHKNPQNHQQENRFMGSHNYSQTETEASLVELMQELSELYTYV